MKEGTNVPYFEGRDSQLLHELAPERVLDALPRLDVAAWKGDRAWYDPLRGLPRSSASTVASLRTRAATHSSRCWSSPTLPFS